MGENKHRFLSMSSGYRWMECQAAPVLSILAPEREGGKEAKLGTMAHKWAELMLTTNLPATEREELHSVLVDKAPEVLARAERYLEYISSLKKAGMEVSLEQKVSLSPLCGGTADCVAMDNDFGQIDIVDLKTGNYAVSASTMQIGLYLLPYWREFGNKKLYKATIVQDAVVSHEWPHAELAILDSKARLAEEVVTGIITGTKYAYAHARTGTWCEYCPVKQNGFCAAYNESVFAPLDGTPIGEFRKAKLPPGAPSVLSTSTRAKMLKGTPKLVEWLKENEEGLLAEAEAGRKIEGFEIGAKRAGDRKWVSPTVAGLALEEAGFGDKMYTDKELISPAKAEKLGPEAKEIVDRHSRREAGKPALIPSIP